MKKIVVGALIVLGIISVFLFWHPSQTIKSIQSQSSNIISSPDPSLAPKIIIDENSDLLKETQKLTPENFSSEYVDLNSQI